MTGIFEAALFVILVDVCDSLNSDFHLTVGPKSGEKGIYIYTTDRSDFKYCRYCPDGAFDNKEANIITQEPVCISKYVNIMEEIQPYERENNKIPVCKIGEIPGCGTPPEEKKTAGHIWSCDPGFSNTIYSVYTSCALISKQTQALTWLYYCNEDLKWELDAYINQSHPVQTEESSNSQCGALKLALVVTGIIFTIVIACPLLGVLLMCVKRYHRDRNYVSGDDQEARSTFIFSSRTENNTHIHDTGMYPTILADKMTKLIF